MPSISERGTGSTSTRKIKDRGRDEGRKGRDLIPQQPARATRVSGLCILSFMCAKSKPPSVFTGDSKNEQAGPRDIS